MAIEKHDDNVMDRSPELIQEPENKTQKPSLYKVLIHNDDFTPFEVVVVVLMEVFNKNAQASMMIMMEAHTNNVGVCGVYSKDVAETKAEQANAISKQLEVPLLFSIEKDE